MKAGTKFTYLQSECPYCKKMIADNWMVRHSCREFEEAVAIALNSVEGVKNFRRKEKPNDDKRI